jgi:hypothetical protein
MVAFFFLYINCLHIILTTMRQSINKHYDTLGGFSAILANVSSHIQAPSVSLKEDETMKQTEKKVGDVIYIDVNKTAQIYAIGSDGNDVRYYYTYEGVRNFIYEKQNALLEKLHSNLIASAPEMLEALYNAQDALYRSGGDQKDIQAIWAVINNAEGGE